MTSLATIKSSGGRSSKGQFDQSAYRSGQIRKLFREGQADLGGYLYTDPRWPGDPVNGVQAWQEGLDRYADQYYFPAADQELVKQNIAPDLPSPALQVPIAPDFVELGPGTATSKIIPILDRFESARSYTGVDQSEQFLTTTKENLYSYRPDLNVHAQQSDIFADPLSKGGRGNTVYLMFGGTLANLPGKLYKNGSQADPWRGMLEGLVSMRRRMPKDSSFILTQDSTMDRDTVFKAYNWQGRLAKVMLNAIIRDHTVEGDFDPANFAFRVKTLSYQDGLVVRHGLEALEDCSFKIDGESFSVKKSQYFSYNVSNKMDSHAFASLAGQAGFRVVRTWVNSSKEKGYSLSGFLLRPS